MRPRVSGDDQASVAVDPEWRRSHKGHSFRFNASMFRDSTMSRSPGITISRKGHPTADFRGPSDDRLTRLAIASSINVDTTIHFERCRLRPIYRLPPDQ